MVIGTGRSVGFDRTKESKVYCSTSIKLRYAALTRWIDAFDS